MLAAHAIPPAGQDPIAWFFKSRRGNGLMLISAFILLARSIGLPVRLAEGYLPGTYDPTRQDIIVRANDATVWAQLAIPGAGWLDLFPATNLHIVIVPRSPQPAPATPTPTAVPGQQLPFLLPGLPSLGNLNASQLTTVLLIVGAALLGVLLLLSLWLFLRWSLLGRKLPPVARFFVRVATLARLAGIPLPASDTAAEATAKVTKHLSLPQAQTLTRLNQTYEHLSYGPAPATVVAGPKSATNTTGQSEFRPVQRSLWRLIFSGAARKSNKESGKQTRPSRTVKVQLSDKQTKLTKLRKRGAV
jgi:hypothetical protein